MSLAGAQWLQVIAPVTVAPAMVVSTTATPDGTPLWVSGSAYAIGDKRRRVETGRVYRRITSGSGTATPEADPENWQDYAPTNDLAMFDDELQTISVASQVLEVVLRPGLVDALAVFGLAGASRMQVWQFTPSNEQAFYVDLPLEDRPPKDYWEYFFLPMRPSTDRVVQGLLPYPTGTIKVRLTGAAQVGCGILTLGEMCSLGYTEYKTAKVTFRDFSYQDEDEDGRVTIKRRGSAKDLSLTAQVAGANANFVIDTLQRLMSVPAAWFGSTLAMHRGLRTFGRGEGSLQYDGPTLDRLTVNVKGNI